MTDLFAKRGSRSLRYFVTGSDNGRPVVLIPGLGGGSKLFGTMPRRFAKDGDRVLTFDPVGIPPSSPLEGAFSFDEAARDVWAIADAAGVERVDLIGTSLGGKVALMVASQQPERVRSLTMLASSAVTSARAKRVYRFFETVAGSIPTEGFADVVAPFLFGRTFQSERKGVLDDIVRATRPPAETRALMVAQARALQEYDGTTIASNLDMPAICFAGREDTLTDTEDVEATARLLPQATLRVFEHAGHSLLLEDADVYRELRAFLADT